MAKTVSFKLSENEEIALEYFKKHDARRSNADVFRSQLMKAYSKQTKERRNEFEAEYKNSSEVSK